MNECSHYLYHFFPQFSDQSFLPVMALMVFIFRNVGTFLPSPQAEKTRGASNWCRQGATLL